MPATVEVTAGGRERQGALKARIVGEHNRTLTGLDCHDGCGGASTLTTLRAIRRSPTMICSRRANRLFPRRASRVFPRRASAVPAPSPAACSTSVNTSILARSGVLVAGVAHRYADGSLSVGTAVTIGDFRVYRRCGWLYARRLGS